MSIALQRTLCLHELCLIWSSINFDQRLAFLNELALLVMNGSDYAGDLTGNRRRIRRSDCAYRLQINADISLLCRRQRSRHRSTGAAPGGGHRLLSILMTQYQPENHGKGQKQQSPYQEASTLRTTCFVQVIGVTRWRLIPRINSC